MVTLTDGSYAPPDVMKSVFLEEYINIASITQTCEKIGLDRRTFYHWKNYDIEFNEQFQIAEQLALGVLEDEAHRRAVTGVDKPIFQGGRQVGTVKEYSDTLLLALLKARAPNKYREKFSGELTGPNGQPLIGDGFKIHHVHTAIPLAQSEEGLIEDINPSTEDLQRMQQELSKNNSKTRSQDSIPFEEISKDDLLKNL